MVATGGLPYGPTGSPALAGTPLATIIAWGGGATTVCSPAGFSPNLAVYG
jgi:hypothetical protein